MGELLFDYRVVELKTTMKFDYMENDEFEEFYTKMKKICDEYNVHLSSIRREQDILNYESEDRVGL